MDYRLLQDRAALHLGYLPGFTSAFDYQRFLEAPVYTELINKCEEYFVNNDSGYDQACQDLANAMWIPRLSKYQPYNHLFIS